MIFDGFPLAGASTNDHDIFMARSTMVKMLFMLIPGQEVR